MFEHLDDPAPPEATARALGGGVRPRRPAPASPGGLRSRWASWWVHWRSVSSSAWRLGPGAVTDLCRLRLPSRACCAEGRRFPRPTWPRWCSWGTSTGTRSSSTALRRCWRSPSDGGDTWTVADPSLPVSFPAQFEFSDTGPRVSVGWTAVGFRRTVALWVTSDGGRVWTRAGLGPVVSDVSAIGPDVWAVVGTCRHQADRRAGVPGRARGVDRQRADVVADRRGPAGCRRTRR